jgi:hypothetical protein
MISKKIKIGLKITNNQEKKNKIFFFFFFFKGFFFHDIGKKITLIYCIQIQYEGNLQYQLPF